MNRGSVNRLELGDKLLTVTAGGGDGVLDAFCDAIGLSPRSGRDYRLVSRLCTPPLRAKIAATGVQATWSILREGARTGAGGVAVDEGYRTLLVLLEEAAAQGRDQLKLPEYHQALGTAPALGDLMDPHRGDAAKLVEYLGGLQGGAREKIVVSLLEADARLRSSVRKTVNEQHRRERDRERIDCGATPGQWMALARDLVRVGDQATGFIARHQSAGALCEEQLPAARDALTKIELMATWIKLRVDGESESARRERGTARVPVAV
ncbi:hypothetical protein [Streptomyces sp. SID12488]|uniref:hypothetical protein n=1 Tax=Streptomyces sp. SID12488 TaxID=2706040 RepID=UPI0013DC7C90|nr:hypothetical protein [Streptomyces sp. SID12488]NEA68120.1 hypothetical protein [Streptomyces sp. SID12488]